MSANPAAADIHTKTEFDRPVDPAPSGNEVPATLRPLSGLRVVDLSRGPMGAVGRYLAGLGADVVLVEPETTTTQEDLAQVAQHRGKRRLRLDASSRSLEAMLRKADICIEGGCADGHPFPAINRIEVQKANPAIVWLSISDFGRTGRFSRWQATEPVIAALSGELSRSGLPGRKPLAPPDNLTLSCAAAQAAFVTVLAYVDRLQSGRGQWLDFSILDGAVQALDPGFGISGSAAAGTRAADLPRDRPATQNHYPIIPCADGSVRICVLAPRQWKSMFAWMGSPAEFADPRFDLVQVRFGSPDLVPAIARFFGDKTALELEEAAQRHGVPLARVLSADAAMSTPQNQARRLFPDDGLFPDGLVEIDGLRMGPATTTAAPGLHWAADAGAIATATAGPAGFMPLAGLRVLDMGVIVVGAETGRLLADAGAEVIKIESAAFPDGSRQTHDGSPISPSFAAGHRNKQSLALDLRHPDGKAVFLRLIGEADVLLSNFKPGTLDALGFDRVTLERTNPRLVSVESSAFGSSGPWSRRMGYGPLVRAATGLTSAWSYADEPGSYSDSSTVYPDHVAARIGALSALALLVRRDRTSRGGNASIAQAEVIFDHFAAANAARTMEARSGSTPSRTERDVPWGIFACAGDDEWCTVTSRGDADWRGLAPLLGLAHETALRTREGRLAHRSRIEQALAGWLSARTPASAMETLQDAGIPAGAMLRVADMPEFAYFKERDFFRTERHPAIPAAFLVEARPVLAQRLPDPPAGPAPLVGEHSVEVLRRWLALSPAEIDALVDAGVVQQLGHPASTRRPSGK
ncbi:CoA transferase [Variovorax sp. J22P168]|nr:CoA transferase [Variovorax sp. J22P168]